MAVARTGFTYVGDVPTTYGASFHLGGELIPRSEQDGMGNFNYIHDLTREIVEAEAMPSSYKSPYDYAPLQMTRRGIMESVARERANMQPRGMMNPDAWRQINDGS